MIMSILQMKHWVLEELGNLCDVTPLIRGKVGV